MCVCVSVCVCVCDLFFIHSFIDEHLVCFQVLAIINSTATNIRVHVSCWIRLFIFSSYMPRGGIAVSYGNSVFSFLKNFHIVLHSACADLHSHQQCRRVPISPHTLQHLFFVEFSKKIFFFFYADHFQSLYLHLLQYCFCFMFWLFGLEACRIPDPWLGIEPTPLSLEGRLVTTGRLGKFYRPFWWWPFWMVWGDTSS